MKWLSDSAPRNTLMAGLAKKTNNLKNVFAPIAFISLVSSVFGQAAAPPDAHTLVERSLAAGEKNEDLLGSYVSRTRSATKQFNSDGSLKSEEVKTYDYIERGEYFIKSLVAKNDQLLTGSERQKEEDRLAKLIAQRKRETPEARARRLEEQKVKRDKNRRFTHELLNAFDYKLTGEEIVDGRKAWKLDAVPHPGFQPKELKAQIFLHLRGSLWLDQADLLWAKADANAFEPFSVGFSMVAKLDQGARISLEQTRLADGVWVVRKTALKATGRLALVKHFSIENVSTSDSFRKVPRALRISDGKEDF